MSFSNRDSKKYPLPTFLIQAVQLNFKRKKNLTMLFQLGVSSDMKSGGKDMGKWDIGILEKVFKKRMDKKGLIVRGERIQELLSFPENADIKNQCVKTVHHPGDKCNKKGEKCKVGEWDQDTIECQINCGDKACLRVADGNFVG